LITVVAGAVLGFVFYAQNPPSMNPTVILNAYAQVLTATIAEILVCWAVVGATFESLTKRTAKAVSLVVGIIAASVLFGVYHFAHSPPFNTVGLVLTLTLVGVITSLFFFISRNVYGSIVFHNFLGIFGVLQALTASGNLTAYDQPMYPAYVLALVSVIIVIAADMRFVRRTHRLRTT
jgi:FtsH-binding integral membrane protein